VDSPRVVIAPANVQDCFYTAIEAVNIARKFNVPVFILSDQAIATRIEAFEEPNLEKVCQDISPDLTPVADYKPYDLSVSEGVVPRVVPGTRIMSGRYRLLPTGTDELGHPTGSPKLHMQMSAKRRKKLQTLGATLRRQRFMDPRKAMCCWSAGVPHRDRFAKRWTAPELPVTSVSALHIKHLNPLPPGLENIFSGFNAVLVVEMNDEGLMGMASLPAAARALLRPENPGHQQDRRPNVESQRDP